MSTRQLDLTNSLQKKYFSLFGPCVTGKSSLNKQQFSDDISQLDLLDNRLYSLLCQHPEELTPLIAAKQKNFHRR
jgi:hypothetical protein